jgi:hypothetical protein
MFVRALSMARAPLASHWCVAGGIGAREADFTGFSPLNPAGMAIAKG